MLRRNWRFGILRYHEASTFQVFLVFKISETWTGGGSPGEKCGRREKRVLEAGEIRKHCIKMRNSPLHSPSPPQITYLRLTCCFLIDFPPVEELSKGLR